MLMNVTVERCYCHDALKPGDARFLMPETLDFAQQHNPLFLSRPRWMQVATCISAYGFLPFYIIIGLAALLDRWASLRVPIMFFIGAKGYAIGFYHLMEFTSETPPPNLVPYFATELPYILSIVLVLMQLAKAGAAAQKVKAS
mmetsp:Transcript_57954/g.154167  ORF Transcript_57954/g.154167 Transcript_57954/m.154167 type:complete len:143 (-) Transcript_57954:97-525(-)